MLELSKERVEEMLHEETVKKEEASTIIRAIYNRYRHLYEEYFADIDVLNNDKIANFRRYNEETISLVKYYYIDLPQDVCSEIYEFEEKVSSLLLGSDWHAHLFNAYEDFKEENEEWNKGEEYYKAKFSKEMMNAFYDKMGEIFRQGVGTESKHMSNVISGIGSLLFGGKKDRD